MPVYGLLWLAATIAFIVIEAASNQMISIWFVAGSVAAMIASIIEADFMIQITVFILVSVIALISFRPMTLRLLKNPDLKTNADALVGQNVLITETVNNIAGTGQGKINGLLWAVRSEKDGEIKAGTVVTVKRIEGVKLIVEEEA